MKKDKKPFSILVIEDNPGDFALIEIFLREQIADPVMVNAGNFKKASEILSAGDINFDVVLLDLSLPDKSGRQLVIETMELVSACPVIILTGLADIDFSISSISLGISDYLLKDDLNATTLYKSILYAMERKKTILQLEASEKRYSSLFHLSPQPMWVFETETLRIVQVNKAAIEHYGYSEEEFLRMTILDICPKEEIEKVNEIISIHKTDENKIFEGKFIHCKKSGEKIEVEIYSNVIFISEKRFRSVIAIDVTEKNQYEHKIIKAIIKTQEDERYQIGAELHDNVCQILATSHLTLGMLKGAIAPAGMQWYNQSEEYITLALKEIRNFSHRLAPVIFDDTTLEEAFRKLFDTFNIQKKYQISLRFDEAVSKHPLSADVELNLYRILQEQLRNILNYAKAASIEVDVHIEDSKLKMRVTDDGAGFDVDKVTEGIGLANMKRRAELFSGKFEINSSPGHGCTMEVNIPLHATA